eukprot:c15465_g1_i4.p1 GENE.c15465_g1_i4~~c15465_g1_i4.p1  ORF type:complete len:160 (+),score=24.16 c15465_g1_i4:470-949(+)
MMAAAIGQLPVFQHLLESGADIHALSYDGCTVAMFAAENGRDEVLKLLIGRGVDINARTMDGWTALILAAEMRQDTTLEILLHAGADVTACTVEGKSVRDFAIGTTGLALIDKEIRRRRQKNLQTFLMGALRREGRLLIVGTLPVDLLGLIASRVMRGD